MANSTLNPPPSSFSSFGGGLIEVAALTALIGSTTAEALVLGNKGAAGLVWGTMSVFGSLSVIRACIAATTPDWLRETLGVRSKETDMAVGLRLRLDDRILKTRSRVGGAVGIACKVTTKESSSGTRISVVSHNDIYAFDQYTLDKIEVLPEAGPIDSFQTYILSQDPYFKERNAKNAWRDWIGILLSLFKLVEVTVLWRNKALPLCLISGSCWLFFFVAAISIQISGLSREFAENARDGEIDIIAGRLPTPTKVGGKHKILLGAPQNVRHSIYWRIVWGLGSVACTATVITSYMTVGNQSGRVFATWTGFQIFWLGLRSVFYHFAAGTESIFHHPILLGRSWKGLSSSMKARIQHLVFALSKYQMHVHPRGHYCYIEDERSMENLHEFVSEYPLSPTEIGDESVDLSVKAVIGDTMLSSTAWILGSKMTGLDLYDSCIVIVNIKGSSIAIPSARVLTDLPPPRSPDVEVGTEPQFPPRGGSNRGEDIAWWYWIPCKDGLWLQVHSQDMAFLGRRRASVVSDEQVTKKLKSGDLFVGISEVTHVREIVHHSAAGCELLKRLLH